MKQRVSSGLLFLCLSVLLCLNQTARAAEKKGQYMIKVNKQQNVVNIYQKNKKGNYKPDRAFVCSTGAATPLGSFSLGAKYRWHQLMGPSYGQYCTRVYQGILFHSVWYYKPSKNTQSYVQYNRLGTMASHGCIRLTVSASKWIYDHCSSGTRVIIYNSRNPGPFGKPKARKMSGYMGWDPTDPDLNNPYFMQSFKLSVKKKTLTLGTKKTVAKFQLRVKNIKPKKAMIKKVKYKSTNPRIASVSQKGVVKAKKPGRCRILVEAADGSGVRKGCKIIVKKKKEKPKSKVTPPPTSTPEPTAEPTSGPEDTAEPERTASPVPEVE